MMQQRTEADFVFEQISGDYHVWERAVRAAAPELGDAEVQDRALRSVLAQFRYELSVEGFAQVKSRLARARREAHETHADAVTMWDRARTLRATAHADGNGSRGARTFRDGDGQVWSVREVGTPAAWSRGEHCLVFSSEMVVRRVWGVPPDWSSLSDEELERLSWTR